MDDGNGYDCGGTADNDYILHTIGLCADLDLLERNRLTRECWLFLHKKIGAVLSGNGWQILYWPAGRRRIVRWVRTAKIINHEWTRINTKKTL